VSVGGPPIPAGPDCADRVHDDEGAERTFGGTTRSGRDGDADDVESLAPPTPDDDDVRRRTTTTRTTSSVDVAVGVGGRYEVVV